MLDVAYPLRTARLDLRPYESSDLDHLRAMYARADVNRYLDFKITPNPAAPSPMPAS